MQPLMAESSPSGASGKRTRTVAALSLLSVFLACAVVGVSVWAGTRECDGSTSATHDRIHTLPDAFSADVTVYKHPEDTGVSYRWTYDWATKRETRSGQGVHATQIFHTDAPALHVSTGRDARCAVLGTSEGDVDIFMPTFHAVRNEYVREETVEGKTCKRYEAERGDGTRFHYSMDLETGLPCALYEGLARVVFHSVDESMDEHVDCASGEWGDAEEPETEGERGIRSWVKCEACKKALGLVMKDDKYLCYLLTVYAEACEIAAELLDVACEIFECPERACRAVHWCK